MRWIGFGRTLSEEESAAAVAGFRSFWNQHGFGLFAVELKESGEFIGFCGLSVPSLLPEILPAVEIGCRLDRDFWGRGYATEAARASLHFGFNDVGLDEIVSIHQIGNTASERIMQKIGMFLERSALDPTCMRQVIIHRIGRREWGFIQTRKPDVDEGQAGTASYSVHIWRRCSRVSSVCCSGSRARHSVDLRLRLIPVHGNVTRNPERPFGSPLNLV